MNQQPGQDTAGGYRLHPDVVWIARPDGSSRLMHMSANVCALDEASTAWLRAILAVGPRSAAAEVAARHGVETAQVEADMRAFVRDLRRQQLIQPRRARPTLLESGREAAAHLVVPGVLRLVERLGPELRGRAWRLLWVARWAVMQWGWARTVRAWELAYPQRPLEAEPQTALLAAIDEAVRDVAARSWLSVECKERALTCLALTRGHAIPAALIVGVTHNPLQGHVWVEAQGRVSSDNPEHCRAFEPVARYG